MISKTLSFVKKIAVTVFGSVDWQMPAWPLALASKIWAYLSIVRQTPRKYLKFAGITIGVIALVVTGIIWFKHMPKEVKIDVTVSDPAVTRLVEEKWVVYPVTVHFGSSVVPLEYLNKPVTAGIEMKPAIEGEWRWAADTKLVFTPKEGVDWPVGGEFKITLAKKGLVAKHVNLKTYELTFRSASFSAAISSAYFYQDPIDPNLKKVVATVSFSHPVDTADFDERVRMYAKGGKYPVHVTYDKYKLSAFIHSDPIEIPNEVDYNMLTIESGAHAAKGGDGLSQTIESSVKIPGLYDGFWVNSAELALVNNERLEPEQVMILNASAGVEDKEIDKNISAYLLPVQHPDKNEDDGKEPYFWVATKVGEDILKLSKPVKLEPLPTDRDAAATHSYRYEGEVGRYLYVKVNDGIKSFGGYIMGVVFDRVLRIPEFPKDLKIMQSGSLLSMGGEKKVPLYARAVPGVKFEIGRILPDQIQHLVTQTYGGFQNPSFRDTYTFNQENISEYFFEERSLPKVPPGKAQYFAFDLNKYLNEGTDKRRGLFLFKVQGYDLKKKELLSSDELDLSDSRLILVTDLGILAKEGFDGASDVFVQSIGNGAPISGATVSVIGKNGLPVLTSVTDEGGRAQFATLKGFKNDEAPTLYLVQKDNDLSYLPYNKPDRLLNMSRFDVGGVKGAADTKRLFAYLFSDRGMYRPGDEIIVGMIVKSGVWGRGLKDIPLEAIVTDSRGLVVKKEKIKLSATGFEEVRYSTLDTSPTGTYSFNLYIVKDGKTDSLLGSTTVKVQEFLPDRLKITAHLSQESQDGWVEPMGLKGLVTLQNLFGTPATDRMVRGKMDLSPVTMSFTGFKDYIFFDPFQASDGFTEDLSDAKTDEKGEAEFELNLKRFAKATYRLSFNAEGFEAAGGRSVAAEKSVIVSPLTQLVGYKPDDDLHYITKNSKRSVELVAIDPSVKKVAAEGLKAALIERKYVSVLTKQENGTYKYVSTKKETLINEREISIPEKGLVLALQTGQPGNFALEIKGEDGAVLNRIEYAVAGRANLARSLEKNAELEVVLNKSDFAPGEEIEMQIKAPYTGSGLITIERDRVYKYQWFTMDTTSSVQKVILPEDFEGNGYISVSFVRDLNSNEIFMSPLSYGVAPFSVSLARRTAKVTLKSPDIARPGQDYVIRYKTDRPAKIVIFGVDEGILQVAGYKTPNPLGYFFQKKALEVKTSQILDLILPEFKRLLALSAPGGDEEAALGKNLNPFKRRRDKPVAFWSGIIDADQKERSFEYKVPDYFNGSLRVMAVAVAGESIGVAQKITKVRGDFVIGPNVPTTVAPGDEFEISASVANNMDSSGENAAIQLEVQTSEGLEVMGEKRVVVKISEMKEGVVKFRLRATGVLGSANITLTASMGDKSSKISTDLSVRPAMPYMTTISSGFFKDGKRDVPTTRKMYPEYRTLEASMSPLPLGLAHGLVDYLEKFPYGCTEQLVSKAMPAVVLRNRPDFGYAPEKVDNILSSVIGMLRSRQNADGAFGLWASNTHVSNYASVYAIHFLLEAKERNLAVPPEMINNGMKWLTGLVQKEAKDIQGERVRAYALYLLTRNGTVTSNYLAAIQKGLDDNYKDVWGKDLAGVYLAATYKLLKKDRNAENIIEGYKIGEPHRADYGNYFDGLTNDAQLIYILAKHFPQRLKVISGEAIASLAGYIGQSVYNTISSSYSILALDAYALATSGIKVEGFSAGEVIASGDMTPLVLAGGLFPTVDFSDQATAIRFTNESDINAFYTVTQAGYDLAMPVEEIKKGVEILREYTDSSGKPLQQVELGSEALVHVKVRSLGGWIDNLVVADLLPGGFEVVFEVREEEEPRRGCGSEGDHNEGYEGDGEGDSDEGGSYESGCAGAWDYEYKPPIGVADKSSWKIEYADVREDRVVLYGGVSDQVQAFVYKIKATNVGTFAVPPTFGGSMYDRGILTRSLGSKITVVPGSE